MLAQRPLLFCFRGGTDIAFFRIAREVMLAIVVVMVMLFVSEARELLLLLVMR